MWHLHSHTLSSSEAGFAAKHPEDFSPLLCPACLAKVGLVRGGSSWDREAPSCLLLAGLRRKDEGNPNLLLVQPCHSFPVTPCTTWAGNASLQIPHHPGKSATKETSGNDLGGLTLIKWSLCTNKSDTYVIDNNITVEYFGASVWENVHWLVQTQQDLDMTECRPCPPTHPPIRLWDGSTFCPLIISSRFTAHPSSTHKILRTLLWYNLYILSDVVDFIQNFDKALLLNVNLSWRTRWHNLFKDFTSPSLRTQVASQAEHKLVFFFPWLTQINLAF